MMSNAEKLVTLDALNSLNDLSEEERQVALEILKQYSQQGESELFDKLKYADFDEIPVDIDTFMHNPLYLGKALTDPEGRFTIFPYWEKCLKDIFPDNLTTKYNNVVFTGAIGLGKAQPLDSLVLTENGFKRMGDITLNDKAYGNDGKLHNIIGIFPQGKKKICKVSFTDGTSTLCCDEHLWTVYNIRTKATTTLTTKELMDPEKRNLSQRPLETDAAPRHRYKIPMTAPIEFSQKELLIDAYTLGVIIGLKNKEKNINKLSNEIKSKIDLNLVYNNINIDKIPSEYLHSSIEDRIKLLQGILDTGGYINAKGSNISFTTSNEQIKNDFIFLIQSLGGTCSVTIRREDYRIGVRLPKSICPFTLIKKVSRLSEKALEPYRYITNIEYVEDDECQCIVLDSKEHLYLTNDFIVTHNSTIAVICLLYMLYRLLCLKDPYLYYGLQPIDKITISLMNITLENAKGVALDKLNQMILASDWFLKHGTMGGETNLIYRPEKHIEFIVASSNNQIIGRALFANFSDEANFALVNNPEKQKERMLKLITQIDARMKSRFMRGTYLPTLNILASSKDTEQSFLETYIATKQATEAKNTLIVDEPQWIVDSRKDSPEKFWVGIGNKFLANELLPLNITEEELDEYRAKGYDLWQVPIGYLDTFQQNLDEAICSIIGIATASSLKYISGEKLNQAKTNTYRNPFNKDIIEVGNAPDDYLQYANFFDMSVVSQEDLSKPLFIHLDMSMTGDKTGIAGVWITGRERNNKPQSPPALIDSNTAAALETTTLDENGVMNDLHYKLAFSVSVKAPKGAQVSFAKNMNFVRWLRDQGFAIKCVSTDSFQSAAVQQQLSSDGFKTKIISVDRLTKDANGKPLCLPYHFLKTAIYERKITIYQKCDLLTNELIGLERKSDGHIDHTKQGINSKDQSDALCLAGDTEIFMLSGEKKTIKDLYTDYRNTQEKPWVLSYNIDTKKPEPVQIQEVVDNGYKNNLIKITLDNGNSFICTEDHLLLTRDGDYVEGKDAFGVSLMPFTVINKTMYRDRQYPFIYYPDQSSKQTGIYLHKLVAETIYPEQLLQKQQECGEKEWVVIHHKDCNTFNSSPENLVYLTNTEHSKVHCDMNQTELKRQQLRQACLKLSAEGKHPFQLFYQEHAEWLKEQARINIINYNKSEKHRETTRATNKRLAAEGKHPFQVNKTAARTPEAQAKREKTCQERYGGVGFKSSIIQEKIKQANLERYNADNPWKNQDIQQKCLENKIKNSWTKIIEHFPELAAGQPTINQIRCACYALNITIKLTDIDLLEKWGIHIALPTLEDQKAWVKLRNKGNCVKLFLKEAELAREDPFTYDDFNKYYENKQATNKTFRHRFKEKPTYEEILALGFNLKNHKVVSIDYLSEGQEVYDIKLNNIHNFAITAGIYVHNCGGLYAASQYSEEYSYQYGDNLTASLEANTSNDVYKKQQMIADFEAELAKIGMDYDKAKEVATKQTKKQQEEWEYYKDISDGIIII